MMALALAASLGVVNADGQEQDLHPMPQFEGIDIEPAFEDYALMMFDVCDAVGLDATECQIYPMMGDIENAVATEVARFV